MAYEDLINQYQDPTAMKDAFAKIKQSYADSQDPLLKKKQQLDLRNTIMSQNQSLRNQSMKEAGQMGLSPKSSTGTRISDTQVNKADEAMRNLANTQQQQSAQDQVNYGNAMSSLVGQANTMGMNQAQLQAQLDQIKNQRVQDMINMTLNRNQQVNNAQLNAANAAEMARLTHQLQQPTASDYVLGGLGTSASVAGKLVSALGNKSYDSDNDLNALLAALNNNGSAPFTNQGG